MIDESVLALGRKKMDQVVELVTEELVGVQTGRAKPAMVEKVRVEAYEGTTMELRELASITIQDARTVNIKPWDASVTVKIEKAINQANLGMTAVADEELIRITVPQLTEERRKELVKLIQQRVESGKAMLRQARIEMKKEIDRQKNQEGVSEDDVHQMYGRLQKLVDEFNAKLEKMEQSKEKELMGI